MAVTTERELRQVLTASLAMRQKEIEDLVFNSTPLYSLLKSKGMIKPYSGPEIRVPLEIDRLKTQWFTGYDKIRIDPTELFNAAVFTPKNVISPFSLSGTELLANEGRAKIIPLLESYMRNAENSVAEDMEAALYGDGTGSGGRSIIGLAGAIPEIVNAGTYGGIDRAQHDIWRTSFFDATTDFPDIGSTWDATTARPIIERIVAMRSKGRRYSDIIFCDVKSYQAISASLVAHQRITSDRMGKLGFETLQIWTPAGLVDVVCAAGIGVVAPEDTIFGIDSEAMTLYYHPSRNFVPFHDGDGAKPINQDAIANGIMWNGELVLSNPRFSWRLKTA